MLEHNKPKLTILIGAIMKFKLTTSFEKRILIENIHRENVIDRLILALQISDPLSPNNNKLKMNKQN